MTHQASSSHRFGGIPDTRGPEVVDLYELLEVSPRASQVVIQAAYRALVRNYHPDINTSADAAQRIRKLNAAYSVLSDTQARARYDLECVRARRYTRLAQRSSARSFQRCRGQSHYSARLRSGGRLRGGCHC